MRSRTITVAALSLAALFLLAACGDDGGSESASADEYCRLSAQLNQSQTVPTDDELDALVEAAPSEIRDDVETLVESIAEGEPLEGIAEAEANVTRFEEENCGGDLAGGGDDENGDSGAPAVVTFDSPSNGDTVSNPVVIEPNVVRAEIAPAASSGPGQGHYHVTIDEDCVASGRTIPADDDHVHFGDGSTTLELPDLEPGEHTLCLQLGDGQHQAFGAAQTITVTVEG